jgi:N-acetylglucosaminyldiphosphoundecaprenol N-acetyl-beta-D-mannosaminyltransferase
LNQFPSNDFELPKSTTGASMNRRVELFGCKIDRVRMPQAVTRVFRLIHGYNGTCRYVVTPNVDHVVMLEHHEGLRRAYEDADVVLADGMPVVLASRLLGRPLPERVTGADLTVALFDASEYRGPLRVFLLGAGPGVAEQAAAKIHARWPNVQVTGTYSPPMGFEKDSAENEKILALIAAASPDVLVVGLGAPKQELWVHAHQHRIEAAVALCVGATIDFLAEHKSRAPLWMQKSGLEWLHRVATEPRRLIKRYAKDAWRFPQLVYREWRRGAAPAVLPPKEIPSPQESIDESRDLARAGAAYNDE